MVGWDKILLDYAQQIGVGGHIGTREYLLADLDWNGFEGFTSPPETFQGHLPICSVQ